MLDMQALIDSISTAQRETRKQYHITLGELAETLKENGIKDHYEVAIVTQDGDEHPVGEFCSYRGYYADLTILPKGGHDMSVVKDVYESVTACIGQTFEGYKGGEFVMEEDTPLWFSFGSSRTGEAIVGTTINHDTQTLFLVTKDVD